MTMNRRLHKAHRVLKHAAELHRLKVERRARKRLHVEKRDHAREFGANGSATGKDIVAIAVVAVSLAVTAFKVETMLHLNSDVVYSVTTTAIAHPLVRWIRHHVVI